MEFTEENFIALTAKASQLASENQQLRQRIDWLLRKMFGRSSEKIHPGQLGFNLEENGVSLKAPEAPLEVDETVRARSGHKRGKRIELPADLPVVEERIIPEEVQAEPEAFRQISEEIFEQLDIVPAQCFKRRIIRPKFVRIDDRSLPPVIAPAPKRIMENSIASVSLLLYLVCCKYIEHLPLYRLEQSLKRRFGVLIHRKLMSGWMYRLAQMLAMIYEALRAELRSTSYLKSMKPPSTISTPAAENAAKAICGSTRSRRAASSLSGTPGAGRTV